MGIYIYIYIGWLGFGLVWCITFAVHGIRRKKKITIITPNLDFVQFELWPRMRDTRTFALYSFIYLFFKFNNLR